MKYDKPFPPENIDEQIEHAISTSSHGLLSFEDKMLQRISVLYGADRRSTERVEQRLAQHLARQHMNPQSSPHVVSLISERRRERNTALQSIERPAQRRAPSRFLFVAAALLMALLVISGVVYAEGSQWIDRVVQSDPGTQGLDFTNVNLTKTVDGNTVSIQKVYADANNVLIAYTSYKDASTVIKMDATLRIAHGGVLPSLSGLDEFYDASAKKAEGSVSIAQFDASAIQGNPQSLSLELQLTPAYLFPLPQGTLSPANQRTPGVFSPPQRATGAPLIFTFTLPFHSGKVVSVNKTVVSHGYALKLERVVIAPSETRIYVTSEDGEPMATDLVVSGWNYHSESGLKASPGSHESEIVFNPSTTKGPKGGFWTLQRQTGTWSVKVTQMDGPSGPIPGTWHFTFIVS